MFSGSLCVPDVVNTISWKVLDLFSPYFHHWCMLGRGWTHQVFGSKGQNSSSWWGPTCWKMYFLALLMQYLENYWTGFHQTFSIDAFWNKVECFHFWVKWLRSERYQGQFLVLFSVIQSDGKCCFCRCIGKAFLTCVWVSTHILRSTALSNLLQLCNVTVWLYCWYSVASCDCKKTHVTWQSLIQQGHAQSYLPIPQNSV